jgi:class 3 adenylate cyclase/predicted ATPase
VLSGTTGVEFSQEVHVSKIEEWLASLGMSEYTQRFAENDIDVSVLRHLTDQDLKELGVSLGHRRKMLAAIIEPAVGAPPQQAASPPAPKALDGAERRQLTVMFCDLVGSTVLATKLDPEDLGEVIGAYHRCCAELINKTGGFVARYLGDGVLAYFGYPRAHEHDAECAVRAGLGLVEAVSRLRTIAAVRLQVRIGIATGPVVVGDLIGDGASENEVVGETPNLAARLQGLAQPEMVVIAGSTRRLLGGLFEYRDLGTMSLKGFDDPVQVWQVTGPSTVDSRFEALRATSTSLIGREEEIELLLRRWDQAKGGEGCVVLISGEPGIGKSRIAQTLLERLRDEPHTRLRYFCSPHHRHTALYPGIMQLERAAGFRRDDTDAQRLNKLEAVLGQATDDLSEAVPLMAEVLSIPVGERYPRLNLTPQQHKKRLLRARLAQVEGLANRQPVLIVYEDLQWSDPTTRESLDLLVDRVPTLRVLVVITFRPEFAPPWVGLSHVTMLNLNRLPPRRCAEIVVQVTGGKRLPREIIDQIVERADGVPLFIEELTKTVIESGLVVDAGDRYTVAGASLPVAIPATLNDSLLARLDRLAPTREVAQIAAALGRRFSYELICAVVPMPKQKIDEALAQLVTAELMFQRGSPPDAEYSFKHALVQDAAYSTLLRSGRQQVHARIVVVLERQFPEIVTGQPALLAHHCGEAALTEKAVGYWLRAGKQSLARSAMTEASAQLQKGLDLLARLPDGPGRRQLELDLQIALGRALIATMGYSAPTVAATFARARALAEHLDRREYLVPLLHGQWAYHMSRSELKISLSCAEQVGQIGESRNDVDVQLLGHFQSGMLRFYLGEFGTARTHFEQCHALGDPAHRAVVAPLTTADPHVAAMAHLAWTLVSLGYFDQARLRLHEVLSESDRLEHAYTRAMMLCFACWVEWVSSSPEQVRRHAEESVALSIENNFPLWLAWGTASRGWSLTALGQTQEGLAQIKQGLAAVRATGTILMTPHWLMLLADAYGIRGQPDEGLSCLTEAALVLGTIDERFEEAELRRLRGQLLNGLGERAEAETNYHQAMAIAKRQGAKVWELRAATGLARLWSNEGKYREARDLLGPIYGWFTEGYGVSDLEAAKALLDSLH